jgi:hypothetical protein
LKAIRSYLVGIFTAAAFASASFAQTNVDSAADKRPIEDFVRQLFVISAQKQLNSPAGQSLRSGELATAPMTTLGGVADPDKIIMLADGAAVFRIPATDGRPDLYLFLARSPTGVWTWTSYRSLALTGMLEALRNSLRTKASLNAAEMSELRNLELTLSSDKQLIAWFSAHRAALDAVRLQARTDKAIGARDKSAGVKLLAKLGLSSVNASNDVVSITIGGMVDNEVGYMHGPPEKIPKISDNGYIWIEPLGADWYLYKTT